MPPLYMLFEAFWRKINPQIIAPSLGTVGGASLDLSGKLCFCPCHLDESGISVSWSNSTGHLPCPTWEPRAQKSRYDFIIPGLKEHCPWILNFMPLFSLALSYPTAIMWLATLYEHHQDILLPEELSVCLWHKLTGCVFSLGSQLASLWRTSPKLKTGSGSLQTKHQIKSLIWHLPLCIAQEPFQEGSSAWFKSLLLGTCFVVMKPTHWIRILRSPSSIEELLERNF